MPQRGEFVAALNGVNSQKPVAETGFGVSCEDEEANQVKTDVKPDRRSRDNARVTITDLSQALNLTKGTVSRALNGYPDISETTRVRVIRAAQAMGYRPLSQAQAIKTGRSCSLGLVIELSAHDAHRPFLAEFLAGLTQAASKEGWTLTIATSESEGDTLGIMRDLVHNRKADGFILPRVLWNDPRIAFLERENTPYICYGRAKNHQNTSYFDACSESSMAEAVAMLAGLGHERIAYIGSASHYAYSHLRRDGYRAGLQSAGLDIDPALMIEELLCPEEAAKAARQLLSMKYPPTAILCATDMLARGVYDFANSIGLKIGSDLSVVGYDGSPEARAMWPRLATFSVDNRKAGAALGAMFIARVRNMDAPLQQELIAAEFCPGGSVGAPDKTPDALAQHMVRLLAVHMSFD
ncbi:LacI family DNA-binding transcriptional regulator [Celeribacter sp.]|uniref:LacI family DNA-binding transcriptional regulator n=1 Tax=Celeribacter sp. TaxID=1890673 RepID=UPI003A8E50A7